MNLKTLNAQAIKSTTETRKMGMSEDAQAIVFQMFTKNIYSNPIGTVVREITSNCFDSHVEAKVNAPVVIRKTFDKLDNSHYISFIDYGVGMSPERIFDVYGMYFKSTKRTDNTQIGGFGIGGKTPLAYKRSTGFGEGEYDNSFNIITNFEGTKYAYVIFEGEDSPGITELFSEPTTDANGTEVRIPVLEKDIPTFKKEMVKQLYYFENVIFEGFVDDEENMTRTEEQLTNEYQIVRGKSFLFRGSDYMSNVHVCLGRVAYPIDYSVLNLSSSDFIFPVAIRLEIGSIGVTPSRESLNYSEATIKMLKSKLVEVKAEIVQLLEKQYESIVTLEDYFKVKNNYGLLMFPNGNSFKIDNVIKMEDMDFSNFKYNFTKMPNDKQLFKLFFNSNIFGKKPKVRHTWRSSEDESTDFAGSYDTLMNKNSNLYFVEGQYERKIVKQAWLKEKHTTYYMISKRELADKTLATHICGIFSADDKIVTVDANGIETPTAFVLKLQELQNEYFEIVQRQCTDYDKLIVPQDFIDGRKRGKLSEEIKKMTIPVKIFGSWNASTRVKLEAMFNLNVPIYYGVKEDDDTIKMAHNMFKLLFDEKIIITTYHEGNHTFKLNGKKGIMFVRVSQGNLKYMQMCKNAYPISKFNTKVMQRKEAVVVEYFQGRELLSKYDCVPDLYKSNGFKALAPEWGKKLDKVEAFSKKLSCPHMSNWKNSKYQLGRYFNLSNVVNTKEQKQYIKALTALEEIISLNEDVLKYIDVPYRLNDASYHVDDDLTTFWNVIKKVLVY